MANQQWLGGTSSSFNTAANWTTAVPVDGDSVFFTASAANDCVADMNQNAKNFAKVLIGGEYTGNVGTGADPLRCAATLVEMDGEGTLFLKADDGVAGADWIDKVIQNNGTTIFDASPNTTQEVAETQLNGGTMICKTGGIFTQIVVNARQEGVKLTIESGVDRIENLYQFGGEVDASVLSDGTNALEVRIAGGGTLIARGSASMAQAVAGEKITLVKGTFDYRSSGTINLIDLFGGKITARKNASGATATITTINGYKGVADLRTGRGLVTATTVNYNGTDFRLLTDADKAWTIADQ